DGGAHRQVRAEDVQLLAGRAGSNRRMQNAQQDRIVTDALEPNVDAQLVVRPGEPAALRVAPVFIDEHHLTKLMLIRRVVAAAAPLIAGVDDGAAGAGDAFTGSRNRVRRLRGEFAAVGSALRVDGDAPEDRTFPELISRERPR